MQFLREPFRAEDIMSCRDVAEARDGMAARCAGIVLTRQMPGDAGVVFITLSDETGVANVVVWPRIFETFRRAVMGGRLLLIEGKVQRSPENVVHLVAERILDRTHELDRLSEDEAPSPRRKSRCIAIPAMSAPSPSRGISIENQQTPVDTYAKA